MQNLINMSKNINELDSYCTMYNYILSTKITDSKLQALLLNPITCMYL